MGSSVNFSSKIFTDTLLLSKIDDLKTIHFQEQERHSQKIYANFKKNVIGNTGKKIFFLDNDKNNVLSKKLKDRLRNTDELKKGDVRVMQFKNKNYFSVFSGKDAVFYELNPSKIFYQLTKSENTTYYIINQFGELVFSNSSHITEKNFIKRPVVQKFIWSMIATSQVEFREGKRKMLGFYAQIPGTNLILFSEVNLGNLINYVKNMANRWEFYLYPVAIVITILVVVLLKLLLSPIPRLSRSIRDQSFVYEQNRRIEPLTGDLRILVDDFEYLIRIGDEQES